MNEKKITNPFGYTQRMMSIFIENSSGLIAKINHNEIRESKKARAFYGILIVAPSKRFSRILNADKEIIVIFSSFREQQVRTILQTRDIINELKGRVETSVAIIVHNDIVGNNKLKKWGRENGLSILPIFYENPFPDEVVLEKKLLAELYSHDPFDITGPVSDDSQFYGRRTEAIDLARKLQSGQIRSCLGIRKTGKTSLMNRIVDETQKYHNAKCIVVDCSKDNIWEMSAVQLMHSLAETVNTIQKIDSYICIKQNKRNDNISSAVDNLINSLNQTENSIIVFFDEIDYITPSSPTGKHWENDFNIFWRNFRAVYQEVSRRNNNLGLLISGVSSKWFNVEAINEIENAALSLVPEEYLSPLARGASIPMIRTLARTSGLIFTEETANIIAQYCSDVPFWIRKACSYIHRNINIEERPKELSKEEIEGFLIKYIDIEGSSISKIALQHLFRVYPELKEPAFDAYNNNFDSISQDNLKKLEYYGIIKTIHSKKQLSGVIIKAGLDILIDSHNSKNTSNPSLINGKEEPEKNNEGYSLNEWAEELAYLNKERNILEKKLRSLVLNFIRFDNLTRNGIKSLSDRLLSIIPSEDKKNYKGLEAETIVEKFYWKNLVELIAKEWSLFEKGFNDKKEFERNGWVINKRYDTHAKDIEAFEVTEYKDALNWLNDKLRKMS